jgi:hypothetical protein
MRRTGRFRITASRQEFLAFRSILSGRRRLCTLSWVQPTANPNSGSNEQEGTMDLGISLLLGNVLMAIFLYIVVIVIWQD